MLRYFPVAALAAFCALLLCQTAQALPDAKLFGQLPQDYDAAISPDGDQVAIIQAHQGRYIVNVVDLNEPDAELRVMGLGEGVKPSWIRWANDDRVILSFWQSNQYRGTKFKSGYLYSIDTKTMKGRILVRPKGFRQFNNQVLDWLEDDPDHILMQFAEDGEGQNYPDIRRVNVETGRDKVVRRRNLDITDWVTDTNGNPIAGTGFKTDSGREFSLLVLDPTDGKWRDSKHFPGLDPEMDVISALSGGRMLVVSAYRDKDTRGIHLYDLVEKRFAETVFQSEDYDAGGVIFSKDGSKIVGTTHIGESAERDLLPEYGALLQQAEADFEGYDVRFIDQTDEGDALVLKVSNAYDPGGMYLYRGTADVTKLVGSYPGLTSNHMGDVVSVRYKARDGVRIPAYVTLPTKIRETSKIKNLPFVVLPHGGPFSRDFKRFDWLTQFFASRGYGVLQMNFRGSTGYGKTFQDAGRDDWTIMQDDVEDGTRYLIEKGYADPNRICVAGWSYGGYAALMGTANDPDLYQCTIAIAALTDVKMAYRDARRYAFGKGSAERTFGGLLDDKDKMRANNPVDRAGDIKTPVLMAHGTLDAAVDHDQFRKMKKELEKAGVDGTYFSFDDEDHYMSAQQNRQNLVVAMERFLQDHLGRSEFAAD